MDVKAGVRSAPPPLTPPVYQMPLWGPPDLKALRSAGAYWTCLRPDHALKNCTEEPWVSEYHVVLDLTGWTGGPDGAPTFTAHKWWLTT